MRKDAEIERLRAERDSAALMARDEQQNAARLAGLVRDLRAEIAALRQGIMDAAARADERVALRLLVDDLLRVVRANHDGGTHEGTDCPICELIARAALDPALLKEARE